MSTLLTQGLGNTSASVLGANGLLSAGRQINRSGIGLSANARAMTETFLAQTSNGFNTIFALGVSATVTVEAAQQGILALRASVPESQLSEEIRGSLVDETA